MNRIKRFLLNLNETLLIGIIFVVLIIIFIFLFSIVDGTSQIKIIKEKEWKSDIFKITTNIITQNRNVFGFTKINIFKDDEYSGETAVNKILQIGNYTVILTAFFDYKNELLETNWRKYKIDIYEKDKLVQSQKIDRWLFDIYKVKYKDIDYFILYSWDGGVSCCGTIQPMIYTNEMIKLGTAINIGKNFNTLYRSDIYRKDNIQENDFLVINEKLFLQSPYEYKNILGFNLSTGDFLSALNGQIKNECGDDFDICY